MLEPWHWPWWHCLLVGGSVGFAVGVLVAARIAAVAIRKQKENARAPRAD